jgi:2-succinyl-5-enolpyruvyl-6-hydroxy-3-cyclohexene-1-carboxylate synthase
VLVPAYRLLLSQPELGGRVRRVIVYGRPTLSRPVTRLLARSDLEVIQVAAPGAGWTDPSGRADQVLPAIASGPGGAVGSDWVAGWRSSGRLAHALVLELAERTLVETGLLLGPLVAAELLAAAERGGEVFSAASNSIRELDLLIGAHRVRVGSNRGLAGIDGTVATAWGLALARRWRGEPGPVWLLTGDLALAHDLNGLLAGPEQERPDLRIVVLNDQGGAIFGQLEPAQYAAGSAAREVEFETLFGTGQQLDLAALAQGYGVAHQAVETRSQLAAALAEPVAGVSLLEVRLPRAARAARAALGHRIEAELRARLDSVRSLDP